MANYGSNLRALFGNNQRKTRSNKGIKRGPRKARVLAPTNIVVVNSGGTANVVAAPGPKKTAGRTHGPMFIGPLRPQNVRSNRKVRSNAGVARPNRVKPNSKAAKTRKLRALARNVLGLSRVPRKGTLARTELNRLM